MNYLEEAKKFGGTPVTSDTKINFLEEAKKMGGAPVPAQQINYLDAAKQFGGMPVAAPDSATRDTVTNPFAVEGAAAAPEVEKSSLWEFPKRLVGGAIELKGMYAGVKQRQAALAMAAPETAMQAFDKIDAGEIKDKAELSKLIGGERKLPSAEEMLEGGGRSPGATVRAFGLAKDYLAASPEQRKALRAQLQSELTESSKAVGEAYELGQEAKRQAAPYEARVKSFFDIENTADALSYIAGLSGQVLPQVGPMVAAGVLTRGRPIGPASVGTAMELGAGTQNRVDFISDKIKDETDPDKRVKLISDYIQKTADVTLTAAIVNGALDAVLGPEKDIAKALLAQSLRDMTRKEIVKQIPKVAAKSGAQEFLTGGLQEIVQINAERKLGEQTGEALTKENIKRVVDSALAEAVGGATITTGFQAGRAAFAKPGVSGVASTSAEGRAIAGLDALANREEAAANAAAETTTRAKRESGAGAAQPLRTLDSLTTQEVSNIERQLFAELGRAPTAEELEGAFNEYIAEQNAGLGVESGASVAGVSDTGAEQPAGAAGVSDTGAAATPDTGGLGISGVSTGQLTDRTTEQLGALEEAETLYTELSAESDAAWEEYQAAKNAYEALTENTPEDVQAEIYNAYRATRDKWSALTDEAIAARENYNFLLEGLKTPEQIADESTEGIPSTEDVEAAAPKSEEVITEGEPAVEGETFATWQGYPVRLENKPFVDKDGVTKQFVQLTRYEDRKAMGARYIYVPVEELSNKDESVEALATSYADELFATNPDYDVEEYDAAATKLFDALKEQGVTDKNARNIAANIFSDRLSQLDKSRGSKEGISQKPVFALPEGYAHGTDYLTSQKIIREGRLVPDAGKRMYSYSQFGRKAVYLTARNGWWLDSDKAAAGRAMSYDASVPFKLDPKANIREVNTKAELDAIAREIGEKDSDQMMRKLNVDNLDEEQAAREIKNLSFEDFVNRQVTRERKLLQKYEAPGADSVVDIASWAAREKKEDEETGRAEIFGTEDVAKYERRILGSLRSQYNRLQNFEAQFREADKVTRKLLDAGIDGIYVGPNFEQVTQEERQAFDKVYDEVAAKMSNADPRDVFNAAVDEYSKINPTYFERVENTVASDQLALFRPELAVVDRARLAATKPGKPSLATVSELPRVDSIERFPLGPTSIKPKVIAENQPLYRETNASGADDLLRDDPQFSYAPIFVTDNPDIALGQRGNVGVMVEFRPNSVSGEISPKPVPGELTGKEYKADVIAPKAVQRITFDNAKILNSLSGLAKRTLAQKFNKKVLPNGKIEFVRKEAAGPSLSPDTVGEYTKQPGETIEEYQERLVTGPKSKLAPHIIELISNNDLTGALNAVAAKFSVGNQIRAFYGDLASRLAELNLPTEIRIGDARNLTRRGIDNITSAQQVRLFAYLRTAQPAIFDKYFKEYYKDSALELVYTGLIELNDPKYKKMLGPVENEFNDVLGAYDDYMPGMPYGSLGAYYPNFDVINLSENGGLNYHTFLHEVVHAATEILLRTPINERTPEQNAAIEELQKLYDLAKNNIKVKEYGLTNLSEFIAEVYTNSSFRNLLKGIPYAPARTNILTRFIQSIMKLVGMDNVAGRAMVEAEKLFSVERPLQTISAGPRFMATKRKKKPAGAISTPDTSRTAESQQGVFLRVMKDAYDGRMEWKDAIKILGPALWDTKNTKLRQVTFPVLNLTHLEDLTRTKFTQITGAVKIIRDMVAYRSKKMNVASDIVKDWTKLQKKNFAQSQLMGRIMLEATMRGRDPDAGVPSGTAPDALDKAWDTLKPEFKEVYRKVRNFYADSVNQMVQEMKRRAASNPDPVKRAKALRKIDEQFGPDKLVKPYFPLRRFGEYFYQVGEKNNKEFYMFESEKDRNAAFNLRREQLSKGNEQQKRLVSSMRMGNGISELYSRNLSTTQALQDVEDLVNDISATDVTDLKDQLKDSLNQLIYVLLPQQSVRKMFIHRKKNVQGASSDMLRVFATTAVHSAYQQSRFMFAEKFLQNLNNARDEIDGARKMGMLTPEQASTYNDFILEVEKRVPYIMSNEDKSLAARVAAKASELTFFYMLSAPFSALLNNIGAIQIALPYLGGPYGYRRASALMVKNLMGYLATTPSRVISPLAKGTFSQIEFPSLIENKNLSSLLKRAAQRFVDDGSIDISVTNDVMNLGDRPSELYTGRYENVKKVLSGLFHQSERLNREVILLTGFELAYEKFLNDYQRQPGMEGLRGVYLRDAQGNKIKNTPDQAFELAIEESTRIATLSLGDYSRQMKGRVFAHPAGMVLLKFKQYPVLAMYAVLRNLDLAFRPFSEAEIDQYRALLEKEFENAPNKDQIVEQRVEEVQDQMKDMRKEGRRRLAGILGTSTVLGGAAAAPLFSVVGLLFQMFSGEDDEDDYFNWENWFLNYMENEFGGYLGAMLANAGVKPETAEKAGRTLGEIGARGLPSAMGAAVADRVSLDPKALLWRDGRFSPDARENFVESLIANSGPVVGLALQGTEAYQLAKDGQYARAVEKMVPAIIAKPLSAIRMKEEGAKTKSGDVLVDDFTATELAMQAIGLQPERLAQKQKAASAIKLKEQKILAERSAIMDRLWMERDNPDAYAEQYDRALDFSEKYPDARITPRQITESFKKRQKAAIEAEIYGARYDKRLRGELGEMGEFAEDE